MPLGANTDAGRLRLAIGPQGEPRLLLPMMLQEEVAGIDAGGALSVTESSFLYNGRAHRFLDLTCLFPDLEQVFGEVVDEIVERVSKGAGSIEAVRSTLDDFRALLAARPAVQVERNRIAGLVAELIVLNRLLDVSSSAWRAWRGPVGDRHDFRVSDTSLEVKASLRAGSTAIIINGLEQLEPPLGGTLHLGHFVLEPVPSGQLTIAMLGTRALSRADDRSGLRDLMDGVGCHDVEDESWSQHAFRMESESLYRVEGDFPRVVPSVFKGGKAPAGVSEITYVVDLSLASTYRCQMNEFDTYLKALAQQL